jgi:hypothetical protein
MELVKGNKFVIPINIFFNLLIIVPLNSQPAVTVSRPNDFVPVADFVMVQKSILI